MATSSKTTSKKRSPVVHFELPYEDRKRMAKFYSNAFGWKTTMLGKKFGEYAVTMTSEEAKDGSPLKKGMINGGFFKKDKDKPAQLPGIVIAVDDIETAIKKVEKAGGEVLGRPAEIPEMGWYVSFFDTEGNRSAMMQPFMKKKKR